MTELQELATKETDPKLIGEEMLKDGTWRGNMRNADGRYIIPQADGSTDIVRLVKLNGESYVVRSREIMENDRKKLLDFNPETNGFEPHNYRQSEFESLVSALSRTREKASVVLWDGKTPGGERTGGAAVNVKTFDRPVAGNALAAILRKVS